MLLLFHFFSRALFQKAAGSLRHRLQLQKQWLQMANHVTGSADPYLSVHATHIPHLISEDGCITQGRHNTHHVIITFLKMISKHQARTDVWRWLDMAYEMSVEPRQTLPPPLFASRREDSEFLGAKCHFRSSTSEWLDSLKPKGALQFLPTT
jgi:hypothetical protein